MKTRKHILTGVLAAALCLLLCATAWADEAARSLYETGSITIHMKDIDSGAAVPGGVLRYYRVAQPVRTNGNDSWGYVDAFAGCKASLEDIGAAELAANLAAYAQDQAIPGQEVTVGEEAQVVLSDLPAGLYLVVQVTAADGYSPVEPFLVSLPTVVDGAYVYAVDSTPKLELKKAPPPPEVTPPLPPKLPQTGQLWWPVPLLAMAGLALMISGVCANRRRPKQ